MNLLGRNRRALAALRPLRDVEGVLGSVVWDTGGNLLVNDLTDLSADALREVGVRVAYLFASFSGDPGQFSGTVMVFAQHRLQLRLAGNLVIGVLMTLDANNGALQMALHIVGRQLDQSISRSRAPAASVPRPSIVPDDTPVAEPTGAESQAAGGVRLYRGQRVPE